jgi:hypothetical protein
MTRGRIAFAIDALCMVAILAACSTLETGAASEGEVGEIAVLEGYWRYRFLYDEQLGISAVDGRRASNFSGHLGSVSLTPERHWIEIKVLRNSRDVARCAFELKPDARRHYQVRALEVEGLLAHPVSSPYEGSIRIDATVHGEPAQTQYAAAVCTRGDALCRQDSDCSPDYRCHTDPGFDFGTCTPCDR